MKNAEWIKGQLVRTGPIKPTEENTDVNLHDYALLSHYLDVILKAHTTEEKKNKLDVIKILNVCASKGPSSED